MKIFKGLKSIMGGGSKSIPPVEKKQNPMSAVSFVHPVATWSEWDSEKAITEGYKSSAVVYACARKRAESVSSVPWEVQTIKGDKWIADENNPVAALLDCPNSIMSWGRIIEIMQMHLDLAGNALLVKIRSKARKGIVELWPLYPHYVTPVKGVDGMVAFYRYSSGGKVIDYPADDVIHMQFRDPSNFLWGMSPLQAAARTVDTDNQAVEWNKASMENRAVPSGAIVIKDNITDDQYEDAVAMVRENWGGASNARGVGVISGDTTWLQMGMSAAEMDFIESRKITRVEICSAYQVPPPMVGFYDDATLSNIETARRVFWRDTVIPLLKMIQEDLNKYLASEYGGNYWIRYNATDVDALRESYSEKLNDAERLQKMGVPFSEINERLDLGIDVSKIPTADTSFLPSGLMPANYLIALAEANAAMSSGEGVKSACGCGYHETKAWGLGGEEEGKTDARGLYWKSVERSRASFESKFASDARRIMRRERDQVVKAIIDGGASPEVVDLAFDGIQGQWKDLITGLYKEVGGDFARRAFNDVKAAAPGLEVKDGLIESALMAVIAFAQKHAAMRATLITGFSKILARSIISQGIQAGNTTDQIARSVRSFYNIDAEYRAMRIARTEVVAASNAGAIEGARSTGVAKGKTWISSRDERVRSSHEEVDGTTVGMDESFIVGGSQLDQPGDPAGEAEDVIHCRCAVSFEV